MPATERTRARPRPSCADLRLHSARTGRDIAAAFARMKPFDGRRRPARSGRIGHVVGSAGSAGTMRHRRSCRRNLRRTPRAKRGGNRTVAPGQTETAEEFKGHAALHRRGMPSEGILLQSGIPLTGFCACSRFRGESPRFPLVHRRRRLRATSRRAAAFSLPSPIKNPPPA